jgi:tRNA1(Val) A37 N6-methylase TrmN6
MEITTNLLLNGRVTLQQPAQGYRAAIDPVLLAAAVPAINGQRVLELGCGVGTALFCLAARVAGLTLTGIDIQPDYVTCAQINAQHNQALGNFTMLVGDVCGVSPALLPLLPINHFDHVVMNPPYYDRAAYSASISTGKTTAHAMANADLALWVKTAHSRLKHHAVLTLIYRADGLADIMAVLAGKFGNIEIIPLWPRQGVAAKRLIIRAKKDSKAPLRLTAGLVLHDRTDYSAAAHAILWDGAGVV